MKRYGLIGFPLTHSFSQRYFSAKFQDEGISDCMYELYSMESMEEITNLLSKHPDLHGLNVTIPYKKLVLSYLDDATNIPGELQACNCIKIVNGKLIGYNTDITGFERSLLPHLKAFHKHALVLGNGGAAAAIQYVLKKLNIACNVVSRKIQGGSTYTYQDLDEQIIKEHKLIINTTPLGTYPKVDDCPDLPYQFISTEHLLYDVVYNPEESVFLQKGASMGAAIKNGYEMLLVQAEESWRIWNEP